VYSDFAQICGTDILYNNGASWYDSALSVLATQTNGLIYNDVLWYQGYGAGAPRALQILKLILCWKVNTENTDPACLITQNIKWKLRTDTNVDIAAAVLTLTRARPMVEIDFSATPFYARLDNLATTVKVQAVIDSTTVTCGTIGAYAATLRMFLATRLVFLGSPKTITLPTLT